MPYCRVAPYITGLMMGYYFKISDRNIKVPKVKVARVSKSDWLSLHRCKLTTKLCKYCSRKTCSEMRVGLRIGRLGDAKLHQTARIETLKFADQLHSCYNAGVLGSSVGRASDSRSRGPGFETRTGHLVVGSDFTLPDLSEGRCAGGDHTSQRVETPNFPEWD